MPRLPHAAAAATFDEALDPAKGPTVGAASGKRELMPQWVGKGGVASAKCWHNSRGVGACKGCSLCSTARAVTVKAELEASSSWRWKDSLA